MKFTKKNMLKLILTPLIFAGLFFLGNDEGFQNNTIKKHKFKNIKRGGGVLNSETAIIYILNSDGGFFSQFAYMLRVYLFAKERNIPFFIEHKNWQYTYKYGWHDYFKTLTVFNNDINYTNIERYENKAEYTGSEVPLYTIKDYVKVIDEIFILNDSLQKNINTFNKNINLNYNSIYVRRGDKYNDGPLPSLDEILIQITIKDDKTPIFIQTDDYTVVEEIEKKFSSCKIFTLTEKTERGSNNQNLLKCTPEERKKHTESLLKACVISAKAKNGWSYFDSNVGVFIKLLGYNNVNLYINNTITKEKVNNSMKLNHKGHPGYLKRD